MTAPNDNKPAGLLTAIKSVLAAFFGVQSAANHQRDAESGRPMLYIVTALIMTVLLVVGLWLGVKAVIASSGTSTASSATQRTAPVTAELAPTPLATLAASALNTIEQRVAPCLSCHKDADLDTASGYIPRIAGKPAGYIYNQLLHFREGRRRNAVMTAMVTNLSDQYLWEMAEYFARREADYPNPQPVTDTAKFNRGEQLALQGDNSGDKPIPACSSCHGDSLVGVLPSVPGLLGLPANYTMAQFAAWQNGSRQAAEPDCMAHIANQLTIDDQQAVAEWLASRELPANVKPLAGKLPDSCGSVPLPTEEPASPELTDGAYLTKLGNCAGCHTEPGGLAMAGGREIESPYGGFIAPNITMGGIGDWSSDDFYTALHNGQRPDGSALYPACPFPSYTNVTRTDSDQILAHLKTLPAVQTEHPAHSLRFPYSQRALLKPWRALKFDAAEYQPNSSQSAEWNRGAYLVTGLGHCAECHNERDWLGAVKTDEAQRGALINGWHAASLNADGGVQSWSQAETVQWLTSGRNAKAAASGPMAQVVHNSLQYLNTADAGAMATYLRDLPTLKAEPIATFLQVPTAAGTQQYVNGKAIYAQQCASCHGAAGEGSAAAIALAGNRSVLNATPINLIQTLLHGGYSPSTSANPRPYGMPPYQQLLSNEDAASVLTYIRNDWGNSAAAISPKDIVRFYRR